MNSTFQPDDMGKSRECDLRHTESAADRRAGARLGATVNSVFGAELPLEATDDEDRAITAAAPNRDDWLANNVPPHHI